MIEVKDNEYVTDKIEPQEYDRNAKPYSEDETENMYMQLAKEYMEANYGGTYIPLSVEGEYVWLYDDEEDPANVVYVKFLSAGKEFHYDDCYAEVHAVPEYKAALDEYLSTVLEEGTYKIVNVDIQEIDEGEGDILSRVGARVNIFLIDNLGSYEDAYRIAFDCGQWMKSLNCKYTLFFTFNFQNEERFLETTEDNYEEQIRNNGRLFFIDTIFDNDNNVIEIREDSSHDYRRRTY